MSILYRFLTGVDDSQFCHKVTKALDDGWALYGSPAYSVNPATGEMRCGQAVTKESKTKYDPDLKLGEQ